MANVFSAATYSVKSSESFFFDANVLIYLHCPIGSGSRNEQRIYSSLYKQILNLKCGLFVNSLVLSEFSNAYLRIDFNLWKKQDKKYSADYKRDFVGSNRFKSTVEDVKNSLKTILQTSQRMTDNFNTISLSNVIDEFGRSDFNDAYYLELARMNHWKIVTHDSDLFKYNNLNVDVITANHLT